MAERRGWQLVQTYADNGINGAKDRYQRPGFDAAHKDAARRRYDVLMVWSIDRLGRSTAAVTTTLAELEGAGVAIYADREGNGCNHTARPGDVANGGGVRRA